VFLQKPTLPQLFNIPFAFYGTPVSLPCSQKPAICPYSEPDHSIPRATILFLMFVLILSPIYAQVFQAFSFLQSFTAKAPCASFFTPTRAICLTHHILLDLVILMISAETPKVMKLLIMQFSPLSL
jgi:hypothetical protein